jgi:aspartate aminotransferase
MIRQVSSSLIRRGVKAFAGRQQVANATIGSRGLMTGSPWVDYEMAPRDPIIGLTEEFNADKHPDKVIVGVGAYRDDAGRPYTLPCVREAEDKIFSQHLDMEYSGIVSSWLSLGRQKNIFL